MDDNRSAGRRAKAYLGKIRQTDRTVQRLLELRFSLRASLYSTGAALSGMPGGGHDPDRTGTHHRPAGRAGTPHRRLCGRACGAEIGSVFYASAALPELSEQDVLIARYLQCKPWPVIAREMHYEERQVYRIHGRALQHFADDLAQT